ncbi:MAG: hypothetical protein ACYCVZ_09825, partial [Streptosporangiaceae bacterium]
MSPPCRLPNDSTQFTSRSGPTSIRRGAVTALAGVALARLALARLALARLALARLALARPDPAGI